MENSMPIPLSDNSELTLYSNDGENQFSRKFRIIKTIGQGSTSIVYLAEYKSDNLTFRCLLKELFPANCGLSRENFVELVHSSGKPSSRYKAIEKRFKIGYDLQVKLNNEADYENTHTEDNIAGLVATATDIYHNGHGILYTQYSAQQGETYDMIPCGSENFDEILSIIECIAFFLRKLHKKGYLMLDIKESNVFVANAGNIRYGCMFDFGSVVTKDELKNYDHENADCSLAFTKSDSTLTLPPELEAIITAENDNSSCRANICTKINIYVHRLLAKTGEFTDLAMLGSIMYHRIFGTSSPPAKDVEKDSWTPPDGIISSDKTPKTKELLTSIFKNTLSSINKRYHGSNAPVDDFIKDLTALRELYHKESTSRITVPDKTILRKCSNKQFNTLTMEQSSGENGAVVIKRKFSDIHNHNTIIFSNTLTTVDNKQLTPSLINIVRPRSLSIFQGDGGVGKSSLLYKFWLDAKKGNNKKYICFYVDLSGYNGGISISLNTADLPTGLLSYIIDNIIKEYCDEYAGLNADETNILAEYLDKLLTNVKNKRNPDPEYILFLDGLNEIADLAIKNALIDDLVLAAKRWSNTSIIVTTRNIGCTVLGSFTRYEVSGISDSEIEAMLPKTIDIDKLKKSNIWELLRLPIFLELYLSVIPKHLTAVSAIYSNITRGKLIELYINTSDCIMDKSDIKNFAVKCILPFIANKMDIAHETSISYNKLNELISKGISFFCGNTIYNNYTTNIYQNNRFFENSINVANEDVDAIINRIFATGHLIVDEKQQYVSFSHQYMHDFFAAMHIRNIIEILKKLSAVKNSIINTNADKLSFALKNGISYRWRDEVCTLFGEISDNSDNDQM